MRYRPGSRFAATTDGFKIAELDLAERNYGDLIGQRQSGGDELRVARLPDDTDLLGQAREAARGFLEVDPLLASVRFQALRVRALQRYPRAVELFRTG